MELSFQHCSVIVACLTCYFFGLNLNHFLLLLALEKSITALAPFKDGLSLFYCHNQEPHDFK